MNTVAIFASGTGTNAIKLLEASLSLPNIHIPCLIVDTKTSSLPAYVEKYYPQVEVHLLLPDPQLKGQARKIAHENEIVSALKKHGVQWIFLAGYMRLLGSVLLQNYNRIINIHPSLLPAYPGLHSYERAFEDQIDRSGVTLHWVDAGLDTGPVIKQVSFPRHKTDTLEDFINRGKAIEWQIYPELLIELNDKSSIGGISYES